MNKETTDESKRKNYLPEKFAVKIPTNPENLEKLKNKLISLNYEHLNYFLDRSSVRYITYQNNEWDVWNYLEGHEIISLNDLLTKEMLTIRLGESSGFQVSVNREDGNINIGCQTISAANLKKIFSNVKRKMILCDLFEKNSSIVSIVPEKQKIVVAIDEHDSFVFSMDEAMKLKMIIGAHV